MTDAAPPRKRTIRADELSATHRLGHQLDSAYVANELQIDVPAIIFEAKAGAIGEEIDDVEGLFDSPVVVRPWRYIARPKGSFWS